MKIVTVVGARPQFVKAATVSREIQKYNEAKPEQLVEEIIVHTGQHYDANMSDIFFEEMEIPKPGYTLGVGGGSHGQMTGRQLEKIEQVLLDEKPDKVLVYGDTNSTLAGALAAAKLHIPVLHVEAGLRSFNMAMPEEVNRILTDNVSSKLFCPTVTAVQNLSREGFEEKNCDILNVGDVMFDAARFYSGRSSKPKGLETLQSKYALVTVHRAENTDDIARLTQIVSALNSLAEDMDVVVPLHPRTRKILDENGLELNVKILDPVSYFEMIWLLQNSTVVLTDSGGLQKEAYFFSKPCVTLRDQTEWVELIEAGVNQLCEIKSETILARTAIALTTDTKLFSATSLYGEADAAKKIVAEIVI